MRHSEAVDSKCPGELARKRVLTFGRELYKEYLCKKCKRWVYTPVDKHTPFRFETKIRI